MSQLREKAIIGFISETIKNINKTSEIIQEIDGLTVKQKTIIIEAITLLTDKKNKLKLVLLKNGK